MLGAFSFGQEELLLDGFILFGILSPWLPLLLLKDKMHHPGRIGSTFPPRMK